MIKHTHLFLIVTLFLILSCEKDVTNSEPSIISREIVMPQDIWKNRKLNVEIIKNLSNDNGALNSKRINQYKLIYHFKGDCSSCIAEILEWSKNISSHLRSDQIGFIYINNSIDNYLLEHYSNVSGISIEEEIIVDQDSVFYKNNQIDDSHWYYTNIILLDTKNQVIAYGNPFDHINVKEIYKELELLK